MNNVGEKYLPIGTVVMLKGGSKRVMITGFCSMATEDQNVMYDYAGCMYPEGFLSSDQTALFNHDQIAQIYHLGLVDDEEKKFKASLNALVLQMNANINNQQSVQPTTPVASQTNEPSSEVGIPPIGPGLPGYVAPQQTNSTLQSQTGQVMSNGIQFDANGTVIAAPQTNPVQQPAVANIQFDENGTVISA